MVSSAASKSTLDRKPLEEAKPGASLALEGTQALDYPKVFEWLDGVHVADSIVWCDANRKDGLNFLASALSAESRRDRRILTSEETLKLAGRGKGKIEALTPNWGQQLTIGELKLTLYPSGHVLGGAQLLIERGDKRLVYAHDVCSRSSETHVSGRPIKCDVLAIPATFGSRLHRFPNREEVLTDIRLFVQRCLDDKATPVLVANHIGVAQNLIAHLGHLGFKLKVHRSIYSVAKVYEELGVKLPPFKRFAQAVVRGEVLIIPPILRQHQSVMRLKNIRTALVSPKAIDPAYVYQMRVSAAFPLSNVADSKELLAFIKETEARNIFLTAGYVDEFAEKLQSIGLIAHRLMAPEQLTLFEV